MKFFTADVALSCLIINSIIREEKIGIVLEVDEYLYC